MIFARDMFTFVGFWLLGNGCMSGRCDFACVSRLVFLGVYLFASPSTCLQLVSNLSPTCLQLVSNLSTSLRVSCRCLELHDFASAFHLYSTCLPLRCGFFGQHHFALVFQLPATCLPLVSQYCGRLKPH